MNNQFEQIAEQFGVLLGSEMTGQFERYYELLIEWNQKFNLTAITDREEVYIKHFADSIAASSRIPQGAKLCDVGTGAGFPGIPLKIVRPDLSVTLVDSLNKRVGFLQTVCGELGLRDVTCIHARAEELGAGPARETFDFAVSRAVARLNTLCEYALPLVRVGGTFLAYKANCEEEVAEAKAAVRVLGGKLKEVKKFELCGQLRAYVDISKISPTPKKYPRGHGKEKNQPIL